MGKKELGIGLALALSFLAVLGFMMTPAFEGKNFVAYADEHFDAYAKHSSYFIPEIKSEAEKFQSTVAFEIDMKSEESAKKTALLYANFAEQEGSKVIVSGRLSDILVLALNDADRCYYNDDSYFEEKYGMSAREALYLWHTSLTSIAKKLEQEQRFEESLFIKTQVLMRAIEPAYNFYGIEATPIDVMGGALLIFYVIYTLWWGFAIYFIFEGVGIKVKKAKSKKEV
ncbi:MAG: hypothetical protein QXO16_07610 [Archaeoglobaceae archaeon]